MLRLVFIFSICFILVRVTVELELIPRTLSVRWEFWYTRWDTIPSRGKCSVSKPHSVSNLTAPGSLHASILSLNYCLFCVPHVLSMFLNVPSRFFRFSHLICTRHIMGGLIFILFFYPELALVENVPYYEYALFHTVLGIHSNLNHDNAIVDVGIL